MLLLFTLTFFCCFLSSRGPEDPWRWAQEVSLVISIPKYFKVQNKVSHYIYPNESQLPRTALLFLMYSYHALEKDPRGQISFHSQHFKVQNKVSHHIYPSEWQPFKTCSPTLIHDSQLLLGNASWKTSIGIFQSGSFFWNFTLFWQRSGGRTDSQSEKLTVTKHRFFKKLHLIFQVV